MEERINQALVQLESDLQSLQSAKEQVEKTVGASVDLQKTVEDYIASVKKFCLELSPLLISVKGFVPDIWCEVESVIANIERTCSSLITAFNTNVDQATTTFQAETKTVLDNFNNENNKLTEQVEFLNDLQEQIKKASEDIQLLKNSLSQISTDLKESQNEQDEALNDIQQKVINLPSQVHEETLSVAQAVSELNTVCQNINSSVITSITNLNKDITGIKDEINRKFTSEIGKLETDFNRIELLNENIRTSIETFSGHALPILDSQKTEEKAHFNTLTRQIEEQEKCLNAELDDVKKQNKVFSFIIIVLLAFVLVLSFFDK